MFRYCHDRHPNNGGNLIEGYLSKTKQQKYEAFWNLCINLYETEGLVCIHSISIMHASTCICL